MALTWDLTNIEGYETACYDANGLAPVTYRLIWTTLQIGIGEITEENAAEFYARLRIAEGTLDTLAVIAIEPADIRRHVGLRTNVKTETRSKWVRRYVIGELDDIAREYEAVTA